ncbi:MAG: transcriptional repressor LexA [bacterium]
MEYLTKRQNEVYNYLADYLADKGRPPSYEEIRAALGLRSLSTVHKHLKQLERKGYLRSPWKSRKRALSLVESGGRSVSLPLLGQVAAGDPIEALEVPEEVDVPESLLRGDECFALRVRGESMIEEGICDGDVIIVKSQQTAERGRTVVALVEGEATVKMFYPRKNDIELRPANQSMESIFAPADSVEIRGVVIGLVRSYK